MKDYQSHLETLRKQAAESELTSALTTDPQKRELFAKHAEHLDAGDRGRARNGRSKQRSDGTAERFHLLGRSGLAQSRSRTSSIRRSAG